MDRNNQSDDVPPASHPEMTTAQTDVSHEAAKMATSQPDVEDIITSQEAVDMPQVKEENGEASEIPNQNSNKNEAMITDGGEEVDDDGDGSQVFDMVDKCEDDPNFAIVCSFFLKFGNPLGITYSIEDLKIMLEDHEHVHEELTELHIKLLRKRRKYINKDKWEKSLVKFVAEYNNVHAWELERFGYKGVKSSIRLELLKRLLEAQFDFNLKFKAEVNAVDANSLRILPIGRDIHGNQFWHQLDEDASIRIYKELADDENSWKLVCKDKDDLVKLMETLKAETTLHPIKEGSSGNNSSSSSSDGDSEPEPESSVPSKERPQSNNEETEDVKPIVVKEEDTEEVNVKIETLDHPQLESISDLKTEQLQSEFPLKSEDCLSQPLCDAESPDAENVKIIVNSILNTIVDSIVAKEAANVAAICTLEQRDIEDHEEVQEVCRQLIDKVCNEEKENQEVGGQPVPPYTGRGRGRSRGRGRGRGRGGSRGATSSAAESRSKTRSTTSSRRYLSRELMELNGLSDQELLISQQQEEGNVPRLRQSRRIQQLQEKKEAEFKERMKKEQERLEAAAKRKAEMIAERERKRQEYQAMTQNGTKIKGKKYQIRKGCLDTSSDSEYEEEKNSTSEDDYVGKKKGRRRKRKGKRESKACPWMDTSDSSHAESEESEEIADDDDDEVLKFDDNDDEFACEDIDPEVEPVVLKRARTVKKAKSVSDSSEQSGEEEEEVDEACKRCSKADNPEWILLCDRCDSGFHTSCLIPPLMLIPDGDWFCPPCENAMLIERLELELAVVSQLLEQKEKEELKKQRLKYVTVNADNIISSSVPNGDVGDPEHGSAENDPIEQSQKSRRTKKLYFSDEDESDVSENEEDEDDYDSEESEELHVRTARRAAKKISYQFAEYDELINSAIRASDYEDNYEAEEQETEEAGETDGNIRPRGKDMATIEQAAKDAEAREASEFLLEDVPLKEDSQSREIQKETENVVSENEAVVKKNEKLTKKAPKKRRLNDLDSPSEEDDSDESFKGSSDTEVDEISEENVSEEEESDEESDDSDFEEYRRKANRSRGAHRSSGSKRNKRGARRGYRKDGFVIDSDDDYGSKGRSRTRGAVAKRKSYREISSDEDETDEDEWRSDSPKEKKKSRKASSDSSDEEWGAKKKSPAKKKRLSWGADDDEDEDDDEKSNVTEEGSNVDEEEESSEEEVKKPKPKAKPKAKPPAKAVKRKAVTQKKSPPKSIKRAPKTKSPPKISERTYEMRGKPRLSKARIMSLREKDEDEDETEDEADLEISGSEKKSKVTDSLSDDDKTEQQVLERMETKDSSHEIPLQSDPSVVTQSPQLQQTSASPVLAQQQQMNPTESLPPPPNLQPTPSRPSTESPLIAAALAGTGPQRYPSLSHSQPPTQTPHHLRHPRPGNNVSTPSVGHNAPAEQSALSALTLFASRGPTPQATDRHRLPPPSPFPPYHSGNNVLTRPEFPVAPGPPPLQAAPSIRPPDNDQYTITNLESFGRQKPLKPTKDVSGPYPPAASPPKLMNLDAPSYAQPGPPGGHFDRYPPPSARYDPKSVQNPLMSPAPRLPPPGYTGIHRPEYSRPANPGPPIHNNPHSFPPHRGYYPHAPSGPPYPQAGTDPRHMYRPPLNSHPQTPVRQPHYEPRHPQSHSGGPPSAYYPHPPHNPELPPGYYGHPHAGYPNQSTGGPPGSGFPGYGPVPPPGMPSSHYAAFYAAAAAGAQNGGFMIQNLLQANAAGESAPPSVSTATSSR